MLKFAPCCSAVRADDLALAAEIRSKLQHVLDRECKQWGMNINGEKAKILVAAEHQEGIPSAIMLQNHALQEVECFHT